MSIYALEQALAKNGTKPVYVLQGTERLMVEAGEGGAEHVVLPVAAGLDGPDQDHRKHAPQLLLVAPLLHAT